MESRSKARSWILILFLAPFIFLTTLSGNCSAGQNIAQTANTFHVKFASEQGSSATTTPAVFTSSSTVAHSEAPLMQVNEEGLLSFHASWNRWFRMVGTITVGMAAFFGLYLYVIKRRGRIRSYGRS